MVGRIVGLLLLLSPVVAGADPAAEAREWYLQEYAPLFFSSAQVKPELIRTFYLDGYRAHPFSGPSTTDDTNSEQTWSQWISELLKGGWLGGAVESIDVDALNESTVVIRTRWSNEEDDGRAEDSCDWYLASRQDDGWNFTNYVQVVCP